MSIIATNARGLKCHITFIYASNFLLDREKLWADIAKEAKLIDNPWFVIGDFYNILSATEKKGGSTVPFRQISGFINCIAEAGLVDIPVKGFKYTWGRKGLATKLDRTLCNDKFLDIFLELIVFGEANSVSDHIPICVKFSPKVNRKRNIPFKYVNTWHELDGYWDCFYWAMEQMDMLQR